MKTTECWKKSMFWISLVCVAAIVFVAVCFMISPVTPEPAVGMEWLRVLRAENVASVRFTVGENPLSYTDYDAEEIPEIVEFLQSCNGAAAAESYSKQVSRTGRFFYVTMNDGTVHTLVHYEGFVEIDGMDYERCDDWLVQWPAEGRVHVDEVQRGLNALEKARMRDVLYLNITAAQDRECTWMRSGDDWYKHTDDGGKCTALLAYDGQQFRREYEYVGPSYVTEDSGWKEESIDDGFALPWPMNEQQDPSDYEYVETTEFKGATIVILRYLPDGTLLHLKYMNDGWLDYYDLKTADGSVAQCSLMNPSSAGTELVMNSYYWAATGQQQEFFADSIDREKTAALAEQCRLALAEFQAADSYSLMETTTIGFQGESSLLVWNCGENWLRQYQEEVYTDTYLQYEGQQYEKYASTTMMKPWEEADLSEEEHCRDSWLLGFQWDPEKIYCDYYAESEMETKCSLFVLDENAVYGYYRINITLNADGRLKGVENYREGRSIVHVYYNDSTAVEAYIEDAYREAVDE